MPFYEEKLYLKSVFNAIDQVYQMKTNEQLSSYEERLRASFNKLLVPEWYNHEHTSANGLRKTKSHGHVPRFKRANHDDNHNNNNNNNNNDNNDDTLDMSVSSSTHSPFLSNGTFRHSYRHRSPSRSWSEKPTALRRDSTMSSYDTNTSIHNGRRSALSNGSATYAPGVQRVAQSSSWYKPSLFTIKSATNGHSVEPPKPLPRYSKITDSGRTNAIDASLTTKTDYTQHPIKPRTMAQMDAPTEELIVDVTSDFDATLVQISPEQEKIENSILQEAFDVNPTSLSVPRTNSIKSLLSEVDSYRSARLPPTDRNLIGTDSSSYASVNDRCLSPSTASFHTAQLADTSSATGYETPTPQMNDEHATLSSHSSLTDLSHAETLEPNAEDLDIVAISTTEQKSLLVSSADVEMENGSLPPPRSINDDSLQTNHTHAIDENPNHFDDFNETCTRRIESSIVREIDNGGELREIDINAVGDEFFLFSPHTTNDDEQFNHLNNNQLDESNQYSLRIFSMEEATTNDVNNTSSSSFHYSSTNDPFGFDQQNNIHSSLMITNLDDLVSDDNSLNQVLNGSYRRPIQEDILYEVEHENSFSDHSQNTSSIIPTNDRSSTPFDTKNLDYLTSADDPITNDAQKTSVMENEKELSTVINDNNVLPIYILPPLYTTRSTSNEASTPSVHMTTNDSYQPVHSSLSQYSDLSSPLMYTPKIRHRQYSVGSYYDNKATAVALNPNYFLGSAPVSPLSRTSTTSSESHYLLHQHYSPTSYDNISLNALRRVNPFSESNTYSSLITTNNHGPTTCSNSSNLYDHTNSITTKTMTPLIEIEPTPIKVPSFEITHPTPNTILPAETGSPSPPRPTYFKQEPLITHNDAPIIPRKKSTLVHQDATYDSPVIPVRKSLVERDSLSDHPSTSRSGPRPLASTATSTSIDSRSSRTSYDSTNEDLEFIRNAIERVFHFPDDTTNESSDVNDSQTSDSVQYPAVEAVQRFYNHKALSDGERQKPNEQVTNLDDIVISSSSVSKISCANSSAVHESKKDVSKVKSSPVEQVNSEEVDDTLNDIEDVDEHDNKYKRPIVSSRSSYTSNEGSPLPSMNGQLKMMNSLHEVQVKERQKPLVVTTKDVATKLTRSTVPPIDIVTEMVIEQDDSIDEHVATDQISDDMVIFYDDIEIVENFSSSSSCSSDSNLSSSTSSSSSSSPSLSHHYSKPSNTEIVKPPAIPPPIPARTLKPIHLVNNNNQQQTPPSLTTNRTYELEKFLIRKKFDVNTVSDMLNRSDCNDGSSVSHRHPSARHFVGKLNNDDKASTKTKPTQPVIINGHENKRTTTKSPFSTLPARSSSCVSKKDQQRSVIADANALVKQIQNSLSRNSLHDTQNNSKTAFSSSTKDLRAFVSETYSPSDENTIDDNGIVHIRQHTDPADEQTFKRQARLSKSFHNVSEYNGSDQYPKRPDNNSNAKAVPSKSVENNLNRVSQSKQSHVPLNITSVVSRTSSAALQAADDNARMLSMKWYTGQVNENSEIFYASHHIPTDDLLHGYVSAHSNRDMQMLLARLQASNDPRIHAALDDIRSRVVQFDASKTRDELHVFMRYLESRLRDLGNKNTLAKPVSTNGHSQMETTFTRNQIHDSTSKEIPTPRQAGRQNLRSSNSLANGTSSQPPVVPVRRSSQSSANQENTAVFDDMLNTVLGLPKKSVSTLPHLHPSKPEKSVPLIQTQIVTNTKHGRDIGKRLFESGTYKDPRLIYDGPRKSEKEEEPLETSV